MLTDRCAFVGTAAASTAKKNLVRHYYNCSILWLQQRYVYRKCDFVVTSLMALLVLPMDHLRGEHCFFHLSLEVHGFASPLNMSPGFLAEPLVSNVLCFPTQEHLSYQM